MTSNELNLPEGMYFYQVIGSDKAITGGKFVIQHRCLCFNSIVPIQKNCHLSA
jgi:hypothetical protein